MSGDVGVTHSHTREEEAVIYDITGAPPVIRMHAPSIKLQPDRMVVVFVNGEVLNFTLAGFRVVKSGLSPNRESETYRSYDIKNRKVPEWVLPYVVSPPPRPRPTVLVTNDDLVRILAGSAMGCSGYAKEESGLSPSVWEPAEFTVRLYTPQELLEAARRARKAAADATGNPDAGQEMTLEQAAALTRRHDLEKILEGRG